MDVSTTLGNAFDDEYMLVIAGRSTKQICIGNKESSANNYLLSVHLIVLVNACSKCCTLFFSF